LATAYRLFQELREDNLSFIYQGDFNDDITSRIIDLSDRNIESNIQLKRLKKKVSFLVAECFQNIIRHSGDADFIPDELDKNSAFMIRNVGGTYYIASANLIPNDKVDTLRLKLKGVNLLEPDELKQVSMAVLEQQSFTDKGGAGVGLIEMARKSGQKLEFHFEQVNDSVTFFYLQVRVVQELEATPVAVSIDDTKSLHDQLTEHNLLMVHRGDFLQDSLLPVLKMIEDNIKSDLDKYKVKRVVYNLMVEILQNITNHAKVDEGKREGVMLLGKHEERYVIIAGNYIDNDLIPAFQEKLDRVINKDKKALKKMYRTLLEESQGGAREGAGLGLTEIARGGNSMVYEFLPVGDQVSFFTLCVEV
ncbi:MAG: SiaB family protein kinase, partial [Bacteroidota bacterium]